MYKYGFNGKENDNEVKGSGNQQDYGARIYDPRLGRFLSVDPRIRSYPMLTTYQFSSNMPISATDLDGLEAKAAFYGAGVHWDLASGKATERNHMSQFKREAERDAMWQGASQAYSALTGGQLVQSLEDLTKAEGSIQYLSIYSHATPHNLLVDNGQFSRQSVGYTSPSNVKMDPYENTSLYDIFKNENIKFEPNALVVFAGCNAGLQFNPEIAGNSIAYEVADYFNVAAIGAVGYTAPDKKSGLRKADKSYNLYYKDEAGKLQTDCKQL